MAPGVALPSTNSQNPSLKNASPHTSYAASAQIAAATVPAAAVDAATVHVAAVHAAAVPADAVPAAVDVPATVVCPNLPGIGSGGTGEMLLRRLAADILAAAAAGAGVAPLVTIIDRSIVRNAAGVDRLWTSVGSGLQQLLLNPLRCLNGRDVRIVLGVYVGTYAAANGAESIALWWSSRNIKSSGLNGPSDVASTSNSSSSTITTTTSSSSSPSAGLLKFAAATAANMYLCIRKDIIFAKLFGRKPTGFASSLAGISRNSSTSSSSFSNSNRIGMQRGSSNGNCSSNGNSTSRDSGNLRAHEACRSKNGSSSGTGSVFSEYREPADMRFAGTPSTIAAASNRLSNLKGKDTRRPLRSEISGCASSSPVVSCVSPSVHIGDVGAATVTGVGGNVVSASPTGAAWSPAAAAGAAGGAIEVPKKFPPAATLLFVVRDSLTIAASFNAPPYVAAWLSSRDWRLPGASAVAAGGSEAVEQHQLQERHNQQQSIEPLEEPMQQQHRPLQMWGRQRQEHAEEHKQQTQENDTNRALPANIADPSEAAYRRTEELQKRPVVPRKEDISVSSQPAAGVTMQTKTSATIAPAAAPTTHLRGLEQGETEALAVSERRVKSAAEAEKPHIIGIAREDDVVAARDDGGIGGEIKLGRRREQEKKSVNDDTQKVVRMQSLQQNRSSAMALSAAQLLCPVGIQFLSTPLHLLSLDLYNRPNRPASSRCSFLLQTYTSTVAARVARILPAFGIGGILNNHTRQLMQQQLSVTHIHASAAGF